MIVSKDLPVKFSEGAIAELARLKSEQSDSTKPWLRVGVKGGGCSGLTYVLEYDSEKGEKDVEYEIHPNLFMIMEKAHELYLLDVEIDFEGGLNSRGFTFTNPNASESCGCGTSFAV